MGLNFEFEKKCPKTGGDNLNSGRKIAAWGYDC